MGRIPGFRQVTLYVEPVLYEQVRLAAHTLGEDIYVFAGEAFEKAVERRMTKVQREAVELMAKQNIKNGAAREKRR